MKKATSYAIVGGTALLLRFIVNQSRLYKTQTIKALRVKRPGGKDTGKKFQNSQLHRDMEGVDHFDRQTILSNGLYSFYIANFLPKSGTPFIADSQF